MQNKVSEETIKEIRQLASEWKSTRDIWKIVGVSNVTVFRHLADVKKDTSNKLIKTINKQDQKKLRMLDKYTPQQIEEILKMMQMNKAVEVNEIIWEPDYLKIGICSDKHYNDKACDEWAITDFYKECDSENVEAVVDWWDMTAGLGIYKSQIFDLVNVDFASQLKHIAEVHPKLKDWKKTYAINGNHDMWWNDVAGINFMEELSKARPDIVNVWSYQGNIILNNIKIWLQHWAKGIPYSISYHLQKYIEKLPQWKEPDIYVLGHYHSALMMDYHWIVCFLPWAFQRWNLLTKRMWLPEDNIGGWIVELIKEWDKIRVNPKYYRF